MRTSFQSTRSRDARRIRGVLEMDDRTKLVRVYLDAGPGFIQAVQEL